LYHKSTQIQKNILNAFKTFYQSITKTNEEFSMCYIQEVESAIEACMSKDGSFSILSADTDKVKSYVYSSTKLPEMRGASIILDRLNQEMTEQIFKNNSLPGSCLLLNKGGSILALVPTSLSTKIQSEIETLYLQETHGLASITVVIEQITKDKFHSEFKSIIRRLSNKLKQEKEQKRLFPVYEVIPYARRCQSCGIRPANVKRKVYGSGDDEYLCKSCEYKRSQGEYKENDINSGKTIFFKEFLDFLSEGDKKRCLKQILNQCLSNARDLGEIGDKDGYIGVIYADGNEIGSKIEKLESPAEFVEFSEKLFRLTKDSLYSALANYISPKKIDNRFILPFEIISIGGDDLFLILPANIALQVANQLCGSFEKGAADSQMETLKDATLSAGVLIAKDSFPVYYIFDLVNQLLKNAKKKAKSGDAIKTAIDFMVFKSQGGEVSNIGNYRDQILTGNESKIRGIDHIFELTFRPYFRDDFQKLLYFVKKLNQEKFPKSKLYMIRESLEEGRENSTIQYLYLMTKSLDREKQLLCTEFPALFLNNDFSFVPWKRVDKTNHLEYKTPIVDILEIFDFIH